MSSKTIYVYADWERLGSPTLIGKLSCEVVRGREVFSFNYDSDWLSNTDFRLLDPDLKQFSGAQYINDDKPNFGIFLDSSPDRWGRVLIKRREAILARSEGRAARPLYETDFLLGVYDGNRMGALRFKLNLDGDFVDSNREFAAPPWTSIRELEYASLQLEDDNSLDFDLAQSVAQHFRVSDNQGADIIEQVKSAVSKWQIVATKYGISRGEQELMASAFRY
ncbi:MAG: hypothetical protein SNJ33_06640 [Rikenellaceae bacterium]